ncbi:hypothetical protein POTOM_014292 [Populus tomentosa]|uniref:DUF7733 domain-containing protein n=1 Tax=Populus tomentosa TaxID=118781 RepID=A0A8X8A7D0_POPTO|nr:hypothetical protein POTOM_014292 [Populus tomentosa]
MKFVAWGGVNADVSRKSKWGLASCQVITGGTCLPMRFCVRESTCVRDCAASGRRYLWKALHSKQRSKTSIEILDASLSNQIGKLLKPGLFLPLASMLGGFARGDDQAVRSVTPHLFLLSFQILTENIISGHCVALVWEESSSCQSSIFLNQSSSFFDPEIPSRAFEKYFREMDDNESKMAEDERFAAANKTKSADRKAAWFTLSDRHLVSNRL